MDRRDRDNLDAHIEQSDDHDAAPPLRYRRQIARQLTAFTHFEHPKTGGDRETWLQGEATDGSGAVFRLDSGAGLGSSHLSLLVEIDGERVWEYIDVTTLTEAWVNAIVDQRRAEREEAALEDTQPHEIEHTDLMAERAIEDAENKELGL